MRDLDGSSPSDEFVKLAIPYSEFDVLLTDIDERELELVGRLCGRENLSPGAFSLTAFPVNGRIHGPNTRYMVPLVIRRVGEPNSRAINVMFLVDTGSPFTCLTVKSLNAIFGTENAIYDEDEYHLFAIQDQNSKIECRTSKAHYKEVNILGADAMRDLRLSIDVNWETKDLKLIKE